MQRDLFLEIGTEEIPARFIPGTLAQLEARAQEMLAKARLSFAGLRVAGTLRRLVLHVFKVAEKALDMETEVKGPPKKVAFNAYGYPTKAALGFARNQGISVAELVIKELDGGEYLFASVREEGQPVEKLLPQLLTD